MGFKPLPVQHVHKDNGGDNTLVSLVEPVKEGAWNINNNGILGEEGNICKKI